MDLKRVLPVHTSLRSTPVGLDYNNIQSTYSSYVCEIVKLFKKIYQILVSPEISYSNALLQQKTAPFLKMEMLRFYHNTVEKDTLSLLCVRYVNHKQSSTGLETQTMNECFRNSKRR